jgi:L-threonylcarbamoyladenylate synthase
VNQPRVVRVDPAAPDPDVIATAADILRGGGLVAFPTETVYGLGAHALSPAAVQRIFAAKGRPAWNPLIVHVPDADSAMAVAAAWPELARRAAEAFWPGPLTLVVPKLPAVPDAVTAGLATVAVRVPAHPVALALLRAARLPVAAPSANRFTRVSPTTAAHVARGLGSRVDLILDGGATPHGIESTVVDVSGSRPVLLRPGAIGADELEPVLGTLDRPAAADLRRDPGSARPSPGMAERHYSPAARVIVYADPAAARASVDAVRHRTSAARVGAIVIGPLPGVETDETVALPADARGYARLFYAALHALDEGGCEVILVEAVPESAAWEGVRDRLRRAASETAD